MERAKKIVVTGATGFVGSQLVKKLAAEGYEVQPLSRQEVVLGPDDLAKILEGCYGVANLAGAPVVQRWSESNKKAMQVSRIDLTRNLVSAFAKMVQPPKVFISTSATGIYADEGEHTETHFEYGTGFLAELAKGWEEEAQKASAHIRTAIFRFGVVLGRTGGPMAQMLLPFKCGLGGKIGSGKQSFSWIHLDDLIHAYLVALSDERYSGVYNLVAPQPTTNLGMTKALGKALSRPTLFTIPAFILRLRFGDGAEVLTKGQRALPERLLDAGFTFRFPDVDTAMQDCVE